VSKRELTDLVAAVLAALALVVQVLLAALVVLALAALVSRRARAWLGEVRATLAGSELWLAWVFALVATSGSLFFSEVGGFQPCRLCWYQRAAMYPLVAVLLVLALLRGRGRAGSRAALLGLPLPLAGAAVSIWHIYIEINPESEPKGCQASVPCSTKWIEEIGYITIPVLALTAFAAILALCLISSSPSGRR
jgi:disulfide bond formation protein DsbB